MALDTSMTVTQDDSNRTLNNEAAALSKVSEAPKRPTSLRFFIQVLFRHAGSENLRILQITLCTSARATQDLYEDSRRDYLSFIDKWGFHQIYSRDRLRYMTMSHYRAMKTSPKRRKFLKRTQRLKPTLYLRGLKSKLFGYSFLTLSRMDRRRVTKMWQRRLNHRMEVLIRIE